MYCACDGIVLPFILQVYINSANVDDYLIDSITRPADDPNAGEVYYRYETNHHQPRHDSLNDI